MGWGFILGFGGTMARILKREGFEKIALVSVCEMLRGREVVEAGRPVWMLSVCSSRRVLVSADVGGRDGQEEKTEWSKEMEWPFELSGCKVSKTLGGGQSQGSEFPVPLLLPIAVGMPPGEAGGPAQPQATLRSPSCAGSAGIPPAASKTLYPAVLGRCRGPHGAGLSRSLHRCHADISASDLAISLSGVFVV